MPHPRPKAATPAGGSAWPSLLGREPEQRMLILHADDVGMCEASVSAFEELIETGTVSSGSVMTACPWFPAVAQYCARNPTADVGVHLTLTSEWHSYRWGPVSTLGRANGLVDSAGYLHAGRDKLAEFATAPPVCAEMHAQIERALAGGIDVTHIDAHMFACLWPPLLPVYLDLAREYQLPALVWQSAWDDIAFPRDRGRSGPAILNDSGFIPLDRAILLDSTRPAERPVQLRETIQRLPAGITHLLVHPSTDTPELRRITPQGWRNRVADYDALRDPGLLDFIRASGVELIGYGALRTALRNEASGADPS